MTNTGLVLPTHKLEIWPAFTGEKGKVKDYAAKI